MWAMKRTEASFEPNVKIPHTSCVKMWRTSGERLENEAGRSQAGPLPQRPWAIDNKGLIALLRGLVDC